MNQDYKNHMRRALPVPSGLGRWKTATRPAGTTVISRSVGMKWDQEEAEQLVCCGEKQK